MPAINNFWSVPVSDAEIVRSHAAYTELQQLPQSPAFSLMRDTLIRIEAYVNNRCPETAAAISDQDRAYMFELRFAAELAAAGVPFRYEFNTGVGGSTVDFRAEGSACWNIELVSLNTTQGLMAATRTITIEGQTTPINTISVGTEGSHTLADEYIKAIQKLGQKVVDHATGQPIKFPLPVPNTYNVLIADIRGVLGGIDIPDQEDIRHMIYGSSGVRPENIVLNSDGQPIAGILESTNARPAAIYARQRIHFIGVISENDQDFRLGGIKEKLILYNNPALISNQDIPALHSVWPLSR